MSKADEILATCYEANSAGDGTFVAFMVRKRPLRYQSVRASGKSGPRGVVLASGTLGTGRTWLVARFDAKAVQYWMTRRERSDYTLAT